MRHLTTTLGLVLALAWLAKGVALAEPADDALVGTLEVDAYVALDADDPTRGHLTGHASLRMTGSWGGEPTLVHYHACTLDGHALVLGPGGGPVVAHTSCVGANTGALPDEARARLDGWVGDADLRVAALLEPRGRGPRRRPLLPRPVLHCVGELHSVPDVALDGRLVGFDQAATLACRLAPEGLSTSAGG